VLTCNEQTTGCTVRGEGGTFFTLSREGIARNIKTGVWRKDAPDYTKHVAELES
jgi:hypothetical protein